MAEQADQAQGAGRHRPSSEPVGVQSLALHLYRQAVAAEVLPVRREFADRIAVAPGMVLRGGPYIAHGTTQSHTDGIGQAACGARTVTDSLQKACDFCSLIATIETPAGIGVAARLGNDVLDCLTARPPGKPPTVASC